MKRLVLMAILKMILKAFALAMIALIIILAIGKTNAWDTRRAYSDAFFVAGCLLIVAGGMTRMAAGQEWRSFLLASGESLHHMSATERANFIINASSSISIVILGLLSGALLILAAVLINKMP